MAQTKASATEKDKAPAISKGQDDKEKGKAKALEMRTLLLLMSAPVIVEDPSQVTEALPVYMAHLEKSLKEYEEKAQADTSKKDGLLDELVQKRNAGELRGYVTEVLQRRK